MVNKNPLNELSKQIISSIENGSYYTGLMTLLNIPDICGALSSENGESSGVKYKAWFDRYVSFNYQGRFNGESCYRLRCGTLHQGKAMHEKMGYSRIIFMPPSTSFFHNNIISDAFNLDLIRFANEMIDGLNSWFQESENSEFFKRNFQHFLRVYPDGLKPYIVGTPVIS